MKTVQQLLRDTDPNELVSALLEDHPVDIMRAFDNQSDSLTIKEARQRIKDKFKCYINRLCNLKATSHPDDMQYIFVMSYGMSDDNSLFYEPTVHLFKLTDVLHLSAKKIDSYDVVMTKQADFLSYFVANTPLTNAYRISLLAKILWDGCFFGFCQEDLQKTIDDILDVDPNDESEWTSMDDFYKEFGLDPHSDYEMNEKLEEKFHKAVKFTLKFNRAGQVDAVKDLRKALADEGYDVNIIKLDKKKHHHHD